MNTRWRRLFPLVVPLILLLMFALSLLLPTPPKPVSTTAFERIRVGMTLGEVEILLGGPPGDYRTGEVDLDLSGGSPEFHNVMFAPEVLLGKRQFQHEWWRGDAGNAWVCFEEGRVVTKEFTPGKRVRRGFRDWLGW